MWKIVAEVKFRYQVTLHILPVSVYYFTPKFDFLKITF